MTSQGRGASASPLTRLAGLLTILPLTIASHARAQGLVSLESPVFSGLPLDEARHFAELTVAALAAQPALLEHELAPEGAVGAWWRVDRTTVEVDAVWSAWSRTDAPVTRPLISRLPPSTARTEARGYQDALALLAGFDQELSERTHLQFGLGWEESPAKHPTIELAPTLGDAWRVGLGVSVDTRGPTVDLGVWYLQHASLSRQRALNTEPVRFSAGSTTLAAALRW